MKKLILPFLLITTLMMDKASAQMDDLIIKHLNAIGGTDALKKITSLQLEGTLNTSGYDIPIVRTKTQDKGMKITFVFSGSAGFILTRADSGWNYFPFMGQSEPVPMAAHEFAQNVDGLDAVDNFLNYKSKGTTAVMQPNETIDGKQCPVVKLTFKNGYDEKFYFDPATYYIIRRVAVKTQEGNELEVQTDYSDFQKTPEGITIARKETSPTRTFTIAKITVNPSLDAGFFTPKVD